MATKKKGTPVAGGAPVDVPRVLVVDDGNKSVARAKAALAKKWSLAREDQLLEAAYLAWFFVALGRVDDARELADHVADRVLWSGGRDVWSAAASSIALAARLAREAGDDARRATLVTRLVEHPAIAPTPREAFLASVAEAGKDVRSAEVDPSQKWALQGFARGCTRAAYFREVAPEGLYEAGTLDVEALEHTIAEGLAGLRAHLGR